MRTALSDALRFTDVPSRQVTLHGTPALESWLAPVREALPDTQLVLQAPEAPALESMQTDGVQSAAAVAAMHQELKDLIKNEQHTGSAQVYLLDDIGLAAGDPSSQASLRAFAAQAISNPKGIVAALTSERCTGTVTPSMEGHREALSQYVRAKGVRLLGSREELIGYLQSA